MFINGTDGYNRHGEQTAKGDFLMVFCKGSGGELRAAVRHVRMAQFGHFMMASTKVGPYSLTLSGTYGDDGLPMPATKSVPRKCWDRCAYNSDEWYERTYEWADIPAIDWDSLVSLPAVLTQEFWHPEHSGWNSAGSEAGNVSKWAKRNLALLKKAGKKPRKI